jgi:hypothetical protein
MFEILDSIDPGQKQKIDLKPKKVLFAAEDDSWMMFELEDGSFAQVIADNDIDMIFVMWNPDVLFRFDPYYKDARESTKECLNVCMDKFEKARRGEVMIDAVTVRYKGRKKS